MTTREIVEALEVAALDGSVSGYIVVHGGSASIGVNRDDPEGGESFRRLVRVYAERWGDAE